MAFMASDAVVVGSSGTKFADEASVRQVIGRLKGLQNREYEVRLDGDRVAAHGKTYGYVPYVDLGVPGCHLVLAQAVDHGGATQALWTNSDLVQSLGSDPRVIAVHRYILETEASRGAGQSRCGSIAKPQRSRLSLPLP
jgi:hypothetical protein